MGGKKKNVVPKKVDNKKADKKLKDIKKVAEDKTFGMKNKNKSKQVQKVINNIASQSKGGLGKIESQIYEDKKKKQMIEENKKLMGEVFAKNVVKGGNSNICQYFKAGLCNKGRKCKFSHDLNEGVKTVEKVEEEKDNRTMKIDLFVDQRELIFGHHREKMNEKDLKEMVEFNAYKYLNANKTEKICEHFLDAFKKDKYGWNWMCPNGHECIFKHCLPEDYVFDTGKKHFEKEDNSRILSAVDKKREQLEKDKLKPITYEQFMDWKNKRMEKLFKEREERTREELKKLGIKKKVIITGVEYFKQNENKIEDAEEGTFDLNIKNDIKIDEDVFNDNEELPDDL